MIEVQDGHGHARSHTHMYVKYGKDKFYKFLIYKGCLPFRQKTGDFDWKSNGTAIFRKFRSKIVEYVLRYSFYAGWYEPSEIFLPSSYRPRGFSRVYNISLYQFRTCMFTSTTEMPALF